LRTRSACSSASPFSRASLTRSAGRAGDPEPAAEPRASAAPAACSRHSSSSSSSSLWRQRSSTRMPLASWHRMSSRGPIVKMSTLKE
jgi:hypothetical protein